MRPRIKSKSASASIDPGDGIYILQKLSLIHQYAGVFETGAVLQPGNIATDQAGATSCQTADKHIFVVRVLHNRALPGQPIQASRETTRGPAFSRGVFWRACLTFATIKRGKIALLSTLSCSLNWMDERQTRV